MAHETFRHLDCASLYQNEKEVGQAIKEAMKDFNISRNELFITSKVSINDVTPKEGWRGCPQKETLGDRERDLVFSRGDITLRGKTRSF